VGVRFGIWATWLVAILAVSTSLVASGNPIFPPGWSPPSRNPSPVISIDSDTEFTESNGVLGGAGTENNPYIISNWTITATHGVGIYIHYTTAYFVISNVVVVSAGPTNIQYGIDLNDVRNGRIEGCIVNGSRTGIGVFSSENVRLIGNEINGYGTMGMDLTSCYNLTVRFNDVNDNFYGIWLHDVSSADVRENNIKGANTGILLVDCVDVTTEDNHMDTQTIPYYDNNWMGNTWPGSQKVIDGQLGRLLLMGLVVPAFVAMALGVYFIRDRRKKVAVH
jgi:parallel beta-helix repeat protein